MNQLWQDVRFSLRMMKKNRGFAAVIILTLAIGIGGNVSIFSFINSILINPLPFEKSEELMVIFQKSKTDDREAISYPEFLDWKAQTKSFNNLTAVTGQSVNFIGRGEPGRFVGGFVSADFFKILGVNAFNGRTFSPGDDQPGAQRVVVLSHEAWVNRLGSDPKIIGQSLNLNGQLFTVVGIAPKGFVPPWFISEIWMPVQYYPSFSQDRTDRIVWIWGRLNPGVSQQQAQVEMNAIAGRLAKQYPEVNQDSGVKIDSLVNILSIKSVVIEDIQKSLWVLLCITAFVLLIVCSNIANLILSRSASRQKEIALRISMGASRMRIVSQLLTEIFTLNIIGGMFGLLLGLWGKDLLIASSPAGIPPGINVEFDTKLFLFTVGITFVSSIISGLVPALKLSLSDPHSALKEGGKGTFDSSGSKYLKNSLVVAQIALTLFLLIGAGLMVKSFRNLFNVDPGFNGNNLLTMEYRVPKTKYPEESQQWAFHKQVVEKVNAVPDVVSASLVGALPHSGNRMFASFTLGDGTPPPQGKQPQAQINRADANYFSTMQIRLIRGRTIKESDTVNAGRVVVINQSMAEHYWPGADPIGKTIKFPGDEQTPSAQIIGIVDNVKHWSLDEATADQIYVAYSQNPHIFATLVVRTSGDPMAAADTVKKAVWSIDKDQPVWKVRSMEFLLNRGMSGTKLMMSISSGFSILALLLAAIGIYGVISYSVNKRTQEIGIRTALGAQRRDILQMVLGHGFKLISIGIGVGLVGAYALTHLISSMLFDVSARDLFTFATVPLLLAIVALLACWIPARRASKVDPMIALRYE